MENLNFCQECEARQATLDISTPDGEVLHICMMCYEEKVRNKELPSEKELGYKFFKDAFDSLPSDKSNQYQKSAQGAGNQMIAVKPKATPSLDAIGKDITDAARNGLLDPIIGRQKEIEKTIRTISRRMKNNPVFVGEPGVGKTAVVEGLAQRIVNGDVPKNLLGKRIVSLNVASLVAGTKYRGEFEDRMIKIIEELRNNKQVILFIDELHTIIGAGGAEGAVDASNIIKPALSRGELQMIGATTYDEYRKYIEKDAALERRFTKIQVEEPTVEESYEILKGLKNKYEQHHDIQIEEEALVLAVDLSHKYISDRFLPDKALDVLDEACSLKAMGLNNQAEIQNLEKKLENVIRKKEKISFMQDYDKAKKARDEEGRIKEQIMRNRVIEKEDVAYIVSEWTGIPLQSLASEEKEKLKKLEIDLKHFVKGQDEAVEMIAKSIRRNRLGLKDPRRPQGVYLLLGPTGVGKTELAKAIAKIVYGSENKMIRFDMSEYMGKHEVSKLIGAPPGYVGHEDEGKLTKLLRRHPYSLILFDEIEKAHPDIFNVMLQLFEEGRITDGKGRVIDGKNAMFLMTSNAGSEVFVGGKSALGFAEQDERKTKKEQVMSVLKKKFKPEFLNRMDDIMVFNQLNETIMVEIAEKMLKEIDVLLKEQNKQVKFTKSFIEHMAKIGYDKEYGARTLRRELDKIKDMISDKMLEEEKNEFSVGVRNGKIYVK